MQAVTARARANGRRIKPRGFHQDIARFFSHPRVPAAHHARQAERFPLVGNHEVITDQRAFGAVQQAQPFPCMGATHHDAALDLVQVEDVGGLTHGEPAKICDVHRAGDRLLTQCREVFSDGAGRRLNRDAANNAGRETATQVRGFDAYGKGGSGLILVDRCRQGIFQLR